MRRGNNTKRPRSHPRSNGRKPPNPNRALESNTPDGVKVRGNPSQLYERYSGLARDAQSSGDRVSAEAFLQYAEHYFRILNASALRKNGSTESIESNDTSGQDSSKIINGPGANGHASQAGKTVQSVNGTGDQKVAKKVQDPKPAVN